MGYTGDMDLQQAPTPITATDLEKRGRVWLVLSFLACPCHLPLTLGFLAVVLGGTALGALVRDHAVVAGVIVTAVWVAGTGRGLWLVRQAEHTGGGCRVEPTGTRPSP